MPSGRAITFVSPPCIFARPHRRPKVHRSTVYASSSLDDEFFLPAESRSDTRAKRNPSSSKQSVSQRRAKQKYDEDAKNETVRANIVNEDISTEDLFGISSHDLLNGADIIHPENFTNGNSPLQSFESSVIQSSVGQIASPELIVNIDEDADKPKLKKTSKTTEAKQKVQPTQTENVDSQTNEEIDINNGNTWESPSKSFIKVGDFVNHERHGIGRFLGLERTRNSVEDSNQVIQEYAVIEYRDGDVFVPLSHFDLIHRLPEAEAKRVTRLDVISSSSAFPGAASSRNRRSSFLAKQRTREKIRRQIVNLHGMYAQRTSFEREPFPSDEKAEKQFFQLCNFTLTNDQREATTQILKDLSQRRQPMDRLLCGDVGFGKTEVAMRAAFRVLNAGKQVIVMAPTTILSQQHFESFKTRLHQYDESINVACFNRFVSRKIVNQSRQDVADNIIRVAIGTHMLLGDRMTFPNLGLLIVDEEHRFGVNQKEKLRARYKHVDTLFLSATPIPRTLHLSLSGLRDASVLRTPPAGRKPVVTKVSKVGSGLVRNAIQKEIDRDGQVFYVVPRIEGIESVLQWIEDLFDPGAIRVLIAHGSSTDLEHRIWSFAQREYDVLLCTSVIENGIDMPSVNTIIVQDASRFGLAQLHQLRGRVGRGDIQAYAWMLYIEESAQSLPTVQKLKALEENSQLGAGFALAQKDMEMRGFGTILGVEQHGNNSVGAEEYARMLAEELEYARTGKPIPLKLPPTSSVEVLIPLASYIPDDYVTNFEEKMSLYKRMSDCKSHQELHALSRRIEEKFGPLPPETSKHFTLIHVKILARQLGIRKIMAQRQHVILDWPIEAAALKRLVTFLPDKVSRDRCEHIEVEERVVIRGLGITSGDVQVTKLLMILDSFTQSAEGFKRDGDGPSLEDALSQLARV